MIKKLLLILSFVLFVFASLFAQKIEYNKKNSMMLIDKVEVAKLEISKDAEKHQVYTFTDLKSDATLVLTGATPGQQPEYYIVSSTLSDKKSEIIFEMVSFTLNQTSAIMNLMVKKYQFFTAAGMDQRAITDFLYVEKRDYSNAKSETANTALQTQLKVDSLAPVYKDNRVVSKNTGELLAVLENTNDGGFLIKDERNNLVARARRDVQGAGAISITTYILNTYDDKQYELKADELSTAKTTAINCLITYDYLGKGVNSYMIKKPQLAAAESQNNRIRSEFRKGKFVTGILTLEDGKSINGRFEIDFRAILPDGTEYPLDDMGVMAPRYKNAVHHYLDDKNKERKRDYREKQMKSFKVINSNIPDYDEFYCKIEYKPEQSNGMGLTSGILKLGGVKLADKIEVFAYRVSDLPKTTLYAGNQRLFIVDKKRDQTVIELRPKTFRDQLKLVVADCPAIEEKLATCEYTRASIGQLIKEYNDCE
ncbi:hypothetical protein M2451_000291 [Dysgonomonas sp. PFB1-18]|uniref:hypothetical protein n=1 Tax=unclassified Dysgonomonas TaxID=2630389 RepID=UPI0024757F81|nr:MULTISPECIES: hypothetical protein [unclassified Dysgonomonas]MDH6307842.1 hypothetical protein [Dysgonomonas sp. PF1-14]MDH6337760.1 hypothetical protein [Dysgonomonas sp. PF1-16]MDH6378984.1 hypothetical protein [Dysgonomonas sp. PFB1-18]MDH6396619.1 hypothetical protein [Dysgonomonas sp. PF1-23]